MHTSFGLLEKHWLKYKESFCWLRKWEPYKYAVVRCSREPCSNITPSTTCNDLCSDEVSLMNREIVPIYSALVWILDSSTSVQNIKHTAVKACTFELHGGVRTWVANRLTDPAELGSPVIVITSWNGLMTVQQIQTKTLISWLISAR